MKNLSNEALLLHFDEEKICEYSNGWKEEGGGLFEGSVLPILGGAMLREKRGILPGRIEGYFRCVACRST